MDKLCLTLCIVFMCLVLLDMTYADGVGDYAEKAKDKLSGAAEAIGDFAKDAYQATSDALGTAKDAVKERIDKITS